jgi:hypothetical protein
MGKNETAILNLEVQLNQVLDFFGKLEAEIFELQDRVKTLEEVRNEDKKAMDSMESTMMPFRTFGPGTMPGPPSYIPPGVPPGFPSGPPLGPLPPIPGVMKPPGPIELPKAPKKSLRDELLEELKKVKRIDT